MSTAEQEQWRGCQNFSSDNSKGSQPGIACPLQSVWVPAETAQSTEWLKNTAFGYLGGDQTIA
jgi:hypothetical protein